MTERLSSIKCFLLDLDGTLYLGDELIDGASRLIHTLKQRGSQYLFLTNNSSRSRQAYVEKLQSLGLPAESEQVLTSGTATVRWLKITSPGAGIYLLGTPSLAEEFANNGFRLVDKTQSPDFVVLGFDTTLTYAKLWGACELITSGTPFIATHPDINCPLADGKYMPDAGAMIAAIRASTGQSPRVIGKPNREMVDAALEMAGCQRGEIAIVGDRLYTDIAMGQSAGIVSILVLSGETQPGDVDASPYRPDHVFASVAELAAVLETE